MSLPHDLQERLKHVRGLPSPPKLAAEIIAMAEDPNLSLVSVAGVVSRDPALTAKILRIANSPLYTRRRRSETLRQAMLLLGLNSTLTVALGFSLSKSLRADNPKGIDYSTLWRRGLLAATAGRALADVLERRDGEEIFLACLLQDIGVLAIDKALPGFYGDASEAPLEHDVLVEHEMQGLGCDHAAVTGWLLAKWHLPERLVLAARHSHAPEQLASGHEHASFVRCVGLAGLLADIWVGDPAESLGALAGRTEDLLGLDFTQLATVLAVMRNQLPETEAIYETDILDAVQVETLLEAAREVVTLRSVQASGDAARLRGDEAEGDATRPVGRDAETGLCDREQMQEYLTRELETARRYDWPVTVACLRVDANSPELMNASAALLRDALRDSELLARHAESDFVIALSGTPLDAGRSACERFLRLLRDASVPDGRGNTYLGIPAWAGIACFDGASTFSKADNLVRAAVRAMHAAVRADDGAVKCDDELPDDVDDSPDEPEVSRSGIRRFFRAG